MKVSISSAILLAMISAAYGRAVALDSAGVDRRSGEGVKYRTYNYIKTSDVPEGVQTYDPPKYLSNECILRTPFTEGVVVDEIPASSGVKGGCLRWWEADNCATGFSHDFDLRLSADRVSDLLFDEVDGFKENVKSFKLTDMSATC